MALGWPKTAQQFSQNTSDSLPCGQGGGGGKAQALVGGDQSAGHGVDTEPVVEVAITRLGQPQDERALIRSWFPKNARVKDQVSQGGQSHRESLALLNEERKSTMSPFIFFPAPLFRAFSGLANYLCWPLAALKRAGSLWGLLPTAPTDPDVRN